MKKYLKYQLKKNLLPFTVLVLFCVIVYVIPLLTESYRGWNNSSPMPPPGIKPDDDYFYYERVYLELYTGNILIALGVMCALVPIYMFAYKMNKRSVDMYYSLPISRTKIAAVHFIVGLLYVLAAYTLGYFLGFAVVAAKVKRLYLVNYLFLYLATLIPAFTIYALSAFFYTRANTIIDGIVFIVAGIFSPFIIATILSFLISIATSSANVMPTGEFVIWQPLDTINNFFRNAIKYGLADTSYSWSFDPKSTWYKHDVCELVGAILMTVGAVGGTCGMLLTEKNCRAENCGQVSDSIFGYKVAIPLYTVALFMMLGSEILLLCIFAFAAFVATVIYRRTIKIGKKQAMLFAIYIVVAFVFAMLVNARYIF